MNNPFEAISNRLDSIETLLYSIKDKRPEHPDTIAAPDDLLTIEQAAAFLHLSKPTIYSKCSRNELPYMKRGKRLYFLKDQLLAYVKAGHHATAHELTENANQYLVKRKRGQRNG